MSSLILLNMDIDILIKSFIIFLLKLNKNILKRYVIISYLKLIIRHI